MLYKNNAPPPGVVYFNYRTSKADLPDPQGLPTLIKSEAMSAITRNEESPLYRTEAIDYPVAGTGGIYTEAFFESFLNRMKAHPFGGNKLGHSYPEKNDFYTIGGKIEKNGDGTGTVFFKIVIPSMGYETTNSGFIRDVLAGNVHFSLVTLPEYELRQNAKTKEMEKHFVKSIGNERNDAVPFEGGAMPQRVSNSEFDIEQVRSLIEKGQIDYKSKGDELIQDGLVTYSALRRYAANADNRTPGLTDLVSLADKLRNRRHKMDDEKVVTKEEAIKVLNGLFMNGLVTVKDILDGIGPKATAFLRNEQDDANTALANSVRELLGDKPLDNLKVLLNTKAENEKFLVQNAVRAQVGTERISNAKGEEVENPAYQYAMRICNGKVGSDLTAALEALKNDSVMQTLLASQADHQSEFNRLEGGGSAQSNAASPAVMEV
ncbi:MAG: hypothetical protein FWH12_02395 [Treponema sp.]|nr:hypothetical protein [Treponema sp.]